MRMDTGEEIAMSMGDKGRSPGLQPIKGGHNTLIDLYPCYTPHTFLYTSVTLSPDNRLSAVKLAPCSLCALFQHRMSCFSIAIINRKIITLLT